MSLHDNMFRFLLMIDLLVVVATLITFFYKISVHSLAMGGLTGILLPLNQAADSGVPFLSACRRDTAYRYCDDRAFAAERA